MLSLEGIHLFSKAVENLCEECNTSFGSQQKLRFCLCKLVKADAVTVIDYFGQLLLKGGGGIQHSAVY